MEPEVAVVAEAAVEPVNPLLRIFPTEVWGLVLDKIKDPKDRANAANSDPLFREHFRSKLNEEIWNMTLLGAALPNLYKHLPKPDLLTLRQVSKGWRNTVDDLLESKDIWKLMYETDDEDDRIMVNLLKYCPLEGQNLVRYNQFVNYLRALPQAKLVGGTGRVQGTERFEFGPFFQEFGTRMYHLQLTLHPKPEMGFIRCAMNVLRSTPNLKTISMGFTNCRCIGSGQLIEVIRFLEENQLPDLPNLVSLRIFAAMVSGGAERLFAGMLVKYGAQLENLKLSRFLIPLPGPMPLLTNLTLYIGDYTRGMKLVRKPANLGTLQSLRTLGSPLQKIKLEFRFDVCLVQLFEILEVYKDSLKHLRLWYPQPESQLFNKTSPAFPSQINLPLLEELEVIGYRINRKSSFDFLANFPKLNKLELEIKDWTNNVRLKGRYNRDNDKLRITENIIKGERYLQQDDFKVMLYLSPIWKDLPLLESMVFWNDRRYEEILHQLSRKDYEYYQDKLAKMTFY